MKGFFLKGEIKMKNIKKPIETDDYILYTDSLQVSIKGSSERIAVSKQVMDYLTKNYDHISYLNKKVKRNETSYDRLISDDIENISFLDTLEDTKTSGFNTLNNIIAEDNFEEMIKILTPMQKEIIKQIFCENLSLTQIASMRGTSVVNICNIKKKALAKIKEYILDNDKMEYEL